MKKAEFIKIVSKIEDTFEDEFRAEFNSPELIWEALIKQLILSSVSKCLHQDLFPVNRHGDSQCTDCGKIISHLDL